MWQNSDEHRRIVDRATERNSLCQQVSRNHSTESGSRADREIDAASQDYKRHADCQDRRDGDML